MVSRKNHSSCLFVGTMVSLNHIAVIGFIFVLAVYSLYTFPKFFEVLSANSVSQQEKLASIQRIFTQTLSDSVPYSPCHYPVHDAPRYSIGDEALTTCIASLKTAATEAATKWPRDAVSTMRDKGQYFKTQMINYILPTWQCPIEERVGGFNDGGKWVCAPRLFLNKDEPCYIYSFGSAGNFEFENALSVINSQCETHTFDPTPGLKEIIEKMTLPKQYHYHFEAFGGKDTKEVEISGETFPTKTMDQFATEFNTPYIDILKIDTEGAELNGIYSTDKDSLWVQNRIGQIFVEIHTDFNNPDTFRRLFDLFDFIVSNGFVLFHSEWNVNGLYAWEFAFVNLDFKKPSSTGTYMERLLTDPLVTANENIAHLSDSAAQIKYIDLVSKQGLPLQFAFNVPEATYHCRNKVLMGDRSDFQKSFMFLCVDTLSSTSTFIGIYESTDAIQGSSVEEVLKSHPLFRDVTTTLCPSTLSVSDRLNRIGDVLQKFDVVKMDLPDLLSVVSSLNHVDSLVLLSESKARVVHIEFHVCEYEYMDLRDRFMNVIELFQYYGYEIYHKEVTFTESLRQEEAGVGSHVCHVAISWIKR